MGNLNMEARQIHYRHDDTMTVDNKLLNLEGRVSTLEDGEPAEVSKADIAPIFSVETAYSAGDYVYHDGHLYKFTTDHAAGTWSDLDTESAVVTSDLAEQAGDIDQLKSGLINVDNATILNTQDLTTPSRTKNLLPMTLNGIKSANTTGTWAGNVYTIGYNTYTVSADDNGVVTSIEGTSTSADSSPIRLDFDLKAGSYILSSGFAELFGYNDTFLQKNGVTIARGNNSSPGQNFTLSEDSELTWFFRTTNITKTAYPMIRLASVTDATFAPYVPSVESRLEAAESGLDTVQSGLTSLDYVKDRVLTGGRNASAGDVVFNMSARGAGIALVSQNGVDSTIILLTTHSNGTFTAQKLIGQDVTIDYSDISAVKFALVAWSKITIYTNSGWTKVS